MKTSEDKVRTSGVSAMMDVWIWMVSTFVEVRDHVYVFTLDTGGRSLISVNSVDAQTGHKENAVKEG